MPIPITAIDPTTLPRNGGVEITVTGTFNTAKTYLAYFGLAGDATDAPCYSGVSGDAYVITPDSATTLKCVSPPAAPGSNYILSLLDPTIPDWGQYIGGFWLPIPTVIENMFYDTVFEMRKSWPPWCQTGPRSIELEPIQVGTPNVQNPMEAFITSLGEMIGELRGYRLTRLRTAHVIGDVTLEVESTYGMAATGSIYVGKEPNPITYTGIDQTPLAQKFTGCSPLTINHRQYTEVADANRSHSDLDNLRRAMLVDYAEDVDLDRIGRIHAVDRLRAFNDTQFRRIMKVLAYLAKSRMYALEMLLDAIFPAGGWSIYESLVEHPCRVFINFPWSVSSDYEGKTFINARSLVNSTTATTITIGSTPTNVESIELQPTAQTLDMTALPSAGLWTFIPESVGAEGAYFSIVGNQLQHVHPAGTDSGRYQQLFLELDDDYNRIEIAWQPNVLNVVGGYPWKLIIEDGEIEYCLIWDSTNYALGQSNEAVVSALGALTAPVLNNWHVMKLERIDNTIVASYNGVRSLEAPVASFAASANRLMSFGYTDNGNANDWTCLWDNLDLYTKNYHNYWNFYGTGNFPGGSNLLQDATNPWVAGDVDKLIYCNALNNENFGLWRINVVNAPGEVQLTGVMRTDGYASSLAPTRFYTLTPRFVEEDIGKSINIPAGLNAGLHVITDLIAPNEVECAASTFVTETPIGWMFDPAFVFELNVAYEMIDAGSNVAAALTIRQALPYAVTPVKVHYTHIPSAIVKYDETIAKGSSDPFYLSGINERYQKLLDEVTAAGVIPTFTRNFKK